MSENAKMLISLIVTAITIYVVFFSDYQTLPKENVKNIKMGLFIANLGVAMLSLGNRGG